MNYDTDTIKIHHLVVYYNRHYLSVVSGDRLDSQSIVKLKLWIIATSDLRYWFMKIKIFIKAKINKLKIKLNGQIFFIN